MKMKLNVTLFKINLFIIGNQKLNHHDLKVKIWKWQQLNKKNLPPPTPFPSSYDTLACISVLPLTNTFYENYICVSTVQYNQAEGEEALIVSRSVWILTWYNSRYTMPFSRVPYDCNKGSGRYVYSNATDQTLHYKVNTVSRFWGFNE
jgi:hypothetical protein